ncbi:hypothetical protein KI387_011048, partial [Taxus chinensis]
MEGKSKRRLTVSPAVAYEIAAAAASYLHSQTQYLLPYKPRDKSEHDVDEKLSKETKQEVASFIATSSVTAVVAAEEETKQAVANDLQSIHSSPCEWFICDEESTHTRLFVIQGSESLASWQANLFFEPIQFEGFDVLVHRGIYEAAKGIYQQMLPEVYAHLQTYGEDTRFRFMGHSLGGSPFCVGKFDASDKRSGALVLVAASYNIWITLYNVRG